MSKIGHLSVKLISDSVFFGDIVSIEVRDSQMNLVSRGNYGLQLDLPVGLYEVSAVLEDGQKHNHLVQIIEGEQTPVEFNIREGEQTLERSEQVNVEDEPLYKPPRHTEKFDSLSHEESPTETDLSIQLLDVQGASVVREGRLFWVFECTSPLESIPTALLRIGDKKFHISLPVSPEREFPLNSCVLKAEITRSGEHAHAWIASERTVANALQNMLASGYISRAADVADQAVDLLRYKYSDPTGAALGALILHRVGRLGRWMSWVKNLAMDFDWLPDGKVLLAILLSEKESSRDQALELALKASSQRMLFVESYSLLLDLLRRWSSEMGYDVRQGAIRELAMLAPYIDWESICLSNTEVEE